MSSEAIQAIQDAVYVIDNSAPSYRQKPGVAVSKLPRKSREALATLTSDEARKMRLDFPPGGDLNPSYSLHGRRLTDPTIKKMIDLIDVYARRSSR